MRVSQQWEPGPLSFRTADLDEARIKIGEMFYDNVMDRLEPRGVFAARFDVARLGPLTVGDLSCGTDVRMRFGELGAYHVAVPLRGQVSWSQGTRVSAQATPARAAVFHPEGSTAVERWSGDCRVLAVKIEPSALQSHLELMLGRTVRAPVSFAPELDVTQGAGYTWAQLAWVVARDLHDDQGLLQQPQMAKQFQEALLSGLLLAADHQYREQLARPATSLRPAPVKRVMDAIQERPDHAFTMSELAAIARVSVRWLQEGFRQHVGMSPMAYLRDVRLTRVHDDLREGDPAELRVSDAAYRWGFTHRSRFAGSYRARFGESPSHTLYSS
ncbi:AraC family transcriptional regulator [Streptomyces sp. H10-C2]|uniref:AraC family transcriptional regulator n=1 Tax=unclassified Streptomyces TaxID=2593676 RepID=UPI0024B9F738|nr:MULTISPECIES: AraC family transcriptional regulator [unclassified Streptomyces]MDJ0343591.1 AraC family transcriptional regulator [Streptomyces sp. PH10-H1]MDJ0373161.1 AraC family transcriptional regulator [Streptomyces sp. H10-C2]